MREKIINLLKNSSSYLSGEEISRQLHISRAGIWKNIEELRHLGYQIEAVPHSGYRLAAVPDKLLPWEIKAGLNTKVLGKEVICHDSVSSTMDAASRLAVEGATEGTIVCSDRQTQGRGRMGRSWVSPKGKGIYLSVILRPALPLNEVAKLTLLTAVAVCEALRNLSGVEVGIKWPNDLLVGKKKIAGILTELNAEVDRVKFVILGIGINVNAARPQLPNVATSIKIETRREMNRAQVIREVLRILENYYFDAQREGFTKVLGRWKELSVTLGQRVSITDGPQKIEGTAVDLAEDGGLLVRISDGKTIKRMSGDVTILGA